MTENLKLGADITAGGGGAGGARVVGGRVRPRVRPTSEASRASAPTSARLLKILLSSSLIIRHPI